MHACMQTARQLKDKEQLLWNQLVVVALFCFGAGEREKEGMKKGGGGQGTKREKGEETLTANERQKRQKQNFVSYSLYDDTTELETHFGI